MLWAGCCRQQGVARVIECAGCKLPDECDLCERWVCSRCERVRPWDDGLDEPAMCCDCIVALGYHEDIANEPATDTQPCC